LKNDPCIALINNVLCEGYFYLLIHNPYHNLILKIS